MIWDYERISKDSRGNLTEPEYMELLALEYVLTWRYSDDEEKDTERLIELRNLKEKI